MTETDTYDQVHRDDDDGISFSTRDKNQPKFIDNWHYIKQESCAIAEMTARCALYTSASHVSSQSQTRVKFNRVFFPILVSPNMLSSNPSLLLAEILMTSNTEIYF